MLTDKKHIFESLAGKLVIATGALILTGSGILWYNSILNDRRNLINNTASFVGSFTGLVKKSIRYDMLHYQQKDIQRIVESIGDSETIRRVRIFDSRGTIYYSSNPVEIGRQVNRNDPACTGCHPSGESPVVMAVPQDQQWRIYTAPAGGRLMNYVEPIYNEPDCYAAPCHAHDPGQQVLGVLTADYSLQDIDSAIQRQMRETSFFMLAFLLASAILLSFILWWLVLRPVSTLARGMERVSAGELPQRLPAIGHDEIAGLTETFNRMTEELNEARRRNLEWTETLEHEVEKKVEEVKQAQAKLFQAEKLAALGRLTADVAHEIRNPLAALGGFSRRLQKLLSSGREKKYIDIVVTEADRLEKILRDVLTFSREAEGHFQRQPVTGTVKESLAVFSGVCEEQDIAVKTDFSEELPVLIDRDQIKQGLINILSNAMDAMPAGGSLTVRTVREQHHNIDYLALHVSDTGEGIPEENIPLIFEPFFTTKKIGTGTGLGLAIARKIMEEHGGFIRVRNRPEGGLTVSLFFPYQSEADLAKSPCWEYMQCGRDTNDEARCPAYPHFGRVCWGVGGTYCAGKVQGTFAQKYEDCRQCRFYQEVTGEPPQEDQKES